MLFAVWLLLEIVLAFNVVDRMTWVLENGMAVVCITALVLLSRRLPLSRISYSMIFLFTCMHTLGAHYTYSQVPYNDWSAALLGVSINDLLGAERNQYDRFVHLCYGLLLAYPIRELVLRVADVRGFWGYFLPLDVTMSTSMLYELIEWGAAVVFGDGSTHYLGTQGDPWDAQKDMLLATVGAIIAMTVTALINVKFQRDFAREWSDSLRVKHPGPLGEEALAAMARDGTWRDAADKPVDE